MQSLFSRRKHSHSTSSSSESAHPVEIPTSPTSTTNPPTPPSAFSHYRKRSVDGPTGGKGIFGGTRGGSGDAHDLGSGSGGLLSLKNKLTNGSRSKLPFFHSHGPAVESTPTDGSKRRASTSTPENDPLKNVSRRRSLALSGMSSGEGVDENAQRREDMARKMNPNLLDSPEVVEGVSWTPLEPTRRSFPPSITIPPTTHSILPTSASTTLKHEEEVDSGYGGSMPGGTSDGSGSGGIETLNNNDGGDGGLETSPLAQYQLHPIWTSMNSSNTTAHTSAETISATTSTPTPTTMDTLSPPASLMSRRQNTVTGMVVVPSIPSPRPIANLPTLGKVGGNGTTSASALGDERSMDVVNGRSRNASHDPESIAPNQCEVREARNAMPVMLREPSHRPAAGPDSDHDHDGGHVGDGTSSEDDSGNGDSHSESGTEETDEATSEENHGSSSGGVRRRDDGILGGIARKPLVPPKTKHARQRNMGGTGVLSINEEEEGDYVESSPPLADRRQVPQPRLGILPNGPSSMFTTSTTPTTIPTSTWGLPTPQTPPGNSSFTQAISNSNPGWMQFGSMTPMARTPGNGMNSFSPRSTNVNQFSKVKELGRTPMPSTPNPHQNGYFDLSTEHSNAPVTTDTVERADCAGVVNKEPHAPIPASTVVQPATTLTQAKDSNPAPIASPVDGPIRITSEAPLEANLTAQARQPLPKQPVILQTFDAHASVPTTFSSLEESIPDTEGGPVIPGTVPEEREAEEREASNPATEDEHNGSYRETSTINSTPQPGSSTADLGAAVMTIPAQPSSPPQVGSVTPDRPNRRPGLYSQISRSMVNLSSAGASGTSTPDSRVHTSNTPSVLRMDICPIAGPSIPSGHRTTGIPDWARPPPTPAVGVSQNNYFNVTPPSSRTASPRPNGMLRQESRIVGSPLKRTRSMDDVRVVNLPEYTMPEPGSKFPQPREEEGREGLPNYWCHVHIEGYLPRKMEFSAPGVQARDRSWKRFYFVLHGTALSVYKHDVHKLPLKEPGAPLVPEVDPADAENLHVHLPGEKRTSNPPPSVTAGSNIRRTSTGAETTADRGRRGSGDMSIQPAPPPPGGRRDSASSQTQDTRDAKDAQLFPTSQRSRAPSNPPSITPSSNSGGTIHAKELASHLPFHGGNALIKQYSMQNAESGLAADYLKRKNVVRVRAEGEQFLLQTESAKEVVDWIEAFQAATNVSLELDVRPMPKIITLPRRRRRRRPGDPPPPGVPATEDTPEGNARAVAAAEAAAAGGGNVDAMERMLAEDQAAGI